MFKIIKPSMIFILLISATHTFAEWEVVDVPKSAGGGYRLHNTDTGQTTETTWKDKKKAKKSAKILNNSDKSVMLDPNGEGDLKEGGDIPGFPK